MPSKCGFMWELWDLQEGRQLGEEKTGAADRAEPLRPRGGEREEGKKILDKICGNRPDITGKILIKWGKNGLPAGRRADKNPEIERAERGVKNRQKDDI